MIVKDINKSQKIRFGMIAQMGGKMQYKIGYYAETKDIFTDGLNLDEHKYTGTDDLKNGDIFEMKFDQAKGLNWVSFFLNDQFLGERDFQIAQGMEYLPYIGLEEVDQVIEVNQIGEQPSNNKEFKNQNNPNDEVYAFLTKCGCEKHYDEFMNKDLNTLHVIQLMSNSDLLELKLDHFARFQILDQAKFLSE